MASDRALGVLWALHVAETFRDDPVLSKGLPTLVEQKEDAGFLAYVYGDDIVEWPLSREWRRKMLRHMRRIPRIVNRHGKTQA